MLNHGGDKTASIPINISLFDYDIGDSRTIYVEATGKTHVGRGTPTNSQGLASCSISAVKLSHIPLGE